ncbi:protein unc-93 homolog A-like [Glandiceps talaboti]
MKTGWLWKNVIAFAIAFFLVSSAFAGLAELQNWYTMIPASIIIGVGAAHLWTAQPLYIAIVGQLLAKITEQQEDIMINKAMSIFYSNCHETVGNITTYCNPPSKELTYVLLGCYVIFGIAALAIVVFFVEDLKNPDSNEDKIKPVKKLGTTLKLWACHRMLLLIPFSFHTGLNLAFIMGDFPKSYISCAIGVNMVGYIFICYGTSSVLVQCLLCATGHILGRVIPMLLAFMSLLSCYILLLVLEPTQTTLTVVLLFVIAAIWGAADGIVLLESTTIHAIVFPTEKEAAFANLALWKAFGNTVGFATSLFLCVSMRVLWSECF